MITEIEIENYKCFEEQGFELSNLNLLAGLNGAGKSSVIQVLLLLRQSYEQNVLSETGLVLNGDYVKVGTAKDALYENAKSDSVGFALQFGSGVSADWRFVCDSKDDVLMNAHQNLSKDIYQESLFSDSFEYLHSERVGPRTSFPISEMFIRRKRRLGKRGEFTMHFLSSFGRKIKVQAKVCHPNGKSSDLIDQVEAWMSEVSPGTRLHFTPYSGMDAINLEYSFVNHSETTRRYRATNVGFGITYVLPVIVAALASEPEALLLIENPEAHLHPKGQVMLGRLFAKLADIGVQMIIETHSDHVINGIRVALHHGDVHPKSVKVYYFSRRDSAGIEPAVVLPIGIDSKGRLTSRPAGFFDEFSKSLDQLLETPTPYGSTNNF